MITEDGDVICRQFLRFNLVVYVGVELASCCSYYFIFNYMGKILLDKLVVAQLVKRCHAFWGIPNVEILNFHGDDAIDFNFQSFYLLSPCCTLKMDAINSSETLDNISNITRRTNPGYQDLNRNVSLFCSQQHATGAILSQMNPVHTFAPHFHIPVYT
jgi:hypothetical protein